MCLPSPCAQEITEYPAHKLRRCRDFDWAEDLILHPLQVGDKILGRWRHPEAGRKWYRGVISGVDRKENGELVYDVAYDDGDREAKMLRKNIKGRETRAGEDVSPGSYIQFRVNTGKEIKTYKRAKAKGDVSPSGPGPSGGLEGWACDAGHPRSKTALASRGGSHPSTCEVDGGSRERGGPDEGAAASSNKAGRLLNKAADREHMQKAKVVASARSHVALFARATRRRGRILE